MSGADNPDPIPVPSCHPLTIPVLGLLPPLHPLPEEPLRNEAFWPREFDRPRVLLALPMLPLGPAADLPIAGGGLASTQISHCVWRCRGQRSPCAESSLDGEAPA